MAGHLLLRGPGLWLLRGRGQRLSGEVTGGHWRPLEVANVDGSCPGVPHLPPHRGQRGPGHRDCQVELLLRERDRVRPGEPHLQLARERLPLRGVPQPVRRHGVRQDPRLGLLGPRPDIVDIIDKSRYLDTSTDTSQTSHYHELTSD